MVKRRVLALALFFVPLPAVSNCHPCSQGHERNRRQKQYQDAAADGVLTFFAGAFGGTVTHGAALTERRRCPKQKKYRETGQAQLHLVTIPTPRCRMRYA